MCYAGARGTCTAWRCALAPPSPSLLVVPDDARCFPSAASIPARRAFELKAIPTAARCVGSNGGWLALSVDTSGGHSALSLFNPITAAEIALPPLIHGSSSSTTRVSKLALAPSPALDDFAAAAICGMDRLAYFTAGARRWAVLDPLPLAAGDHLGDVLYHEEEGSVYCLTGNGDVHVLLLPGRGRREPIMDDEPSSLPPLTMPFIRRWELSATPAQLAEIDRWRRHLNSPAKVQPLLSLLPFNPATSFAPPYNEVSLFTSAKNLVFCGGNLYQIWRNATCTVTVQLPAGDGHRRRIQENEVFVLRYYPDRQPCWDAVADLGGYSVFVGRNNAVSMNAEDVPGVKGNCVYWIGWRGRDQGMVFDMATGRSTPCLPPAASAVARQSTVCWYFLR